MLAVTSPVVVAVVAPVVVVVVALCDLNINTPISDVAYVDENCVVVLAVLDALREFCVRCQMAIVSPAGKMADNRWRDVERRAKARARAKRARKNYVSCNYASIRNKNVSVAATRCIVRH